MKTLTRPLVGKHRHIFIDNFFTSPALLLQDGMNSHIDQERFSTRSEGETNLEEQVYTLYIHTHIYIHTYYATYIVL